MNKHQVYDIEYQKHIENIKQIAMPLKKVLPLLLFFLLPFFTLAQVYQTYDLKKMVPSSPEAAILGRHGDIPVSHYNGTTEVSIPLYSIKENGVEIPIVLRYHSSGIKVSDEASMVGLGWSLEPSGSIIQVINGEHDAWDNLTDTMQPGYRALRSDASNSIYYERNTIGYEWSCDWDPMETTAEEPETTLKIVNGQGQPDIFQFSFAGYSGKFYIHPERDTIAVLNPTVKLKIERWGVGWQITTVDGNRFYFSSFEYSTSDNSSGKYTSQTWKLNRIEFSNGKLITFDYVNGYYDSYSYNETYHAPYPWNIDSDIFKKMGTMTFHNTKYLTQINSDEATVKFNYEDRIDLFSVADLDGITGNGDRSTKRLKSIDITTTDAVKIKSFKFNYSYFIADTVGGSFQSPIPPTSVDAFTKRLRLDSIQEVGYDINQTANYLPATKFEYDSVPLPAKTSFAVDFWGYYNGKHNTELIPSIDYYRWDSNPYYDSMPSPASFIYLNGANRTPDSTKITAGILKRVKYPTGGYTDFKYEMHDFNNFTYTDIDKIRNSKVYYVAEDKNVSYIPSSVTFTIPKTTTIRVTNTINRGPNQSWTFNDFLPCKIYLMKMIQGSFTYLKEWQMVSNQQYSTDFNQDGMVQWVEDVTINYDPNPNAVYIMVAYLPDTFGPQNTSNNSASVKSYFEFYNINQDSARLSIGGGLRIKTVKSYTDASVLASQKAYIYKDSSNVTTGKLMSPLVNLHSRRVHAITALSTPYGTDAAHKYETIWHMASENAIPFSPYGNGVVVGYSLVDEVECIPKNELCGVRRMEYLNNPNTTKVNTPDIPSVSAGKLHKETIFAGNSGLPLKEIRYEYKELSYSAFSGVKAFSNLIGTSHCDIPNLIYVPPFADVYPGIRLSHYSICFYPILTSWMVIDKITTKDYDNANFMTSIEERDYNSLGLAVNTKTTTSEGNIKEAIKRYPVDVSAAPGSVVADMINENILSQPIEELSKVNGTEVLRSKTNYINPFQIVKGSIEYATNGGSFFTDVAFQSYGANKTIRQLEKNGIKSSYLWGYNNTKVIAVVTNAAWEQIGYTAFESSDKGGFTYTGSLISDATAPAGAMCYSLSTGNISKSNTDANTTYIYSYWSKNGMYTVSNSVSVETGRTLNGWTLYKHKVTGSSSGYTISGNGYIDEVRFYPDNAQMISFTYLPVLGISTQTDQNNNIIYYSYDSYGRLTYVKDLEKNVLKKICYNYKGQVEECGN